MEDYKLNQELSEAEINAAVEKAYNALDPEERTALNKLVNEVWHKLSARNGSPVMGEKSIRQMLAMLAIYQTHQGRSWIESM